MTFIGVSADSPAAQTKWQDKKSLPYGLLSDPDRKLISALGANDKGKTKRSHFVFAKAEQGAEGKGKLIDKKLGVKPAESPKLAIEFIKNYVPTATNGEATTSSEANGESSSSTVEPAAVATNGASVAEDAAAPTEVIAEAPATNGTGTEDVAMAA
ncbi:hypothetical protein BT96DRAFT_988517 [Gymnopus androsaceus JB14]|uniref:Alkyl hydroperoxide reductase subunit C/ Thiol specific antioxidant domain-containing protein n=1 Tax=Gymnopus androsaceus JB14 TaxID=1447944 RepID=A0A6A4I754_9AGAR|nr:hypothetical protein BT96DRAFT_988517 [Gymnopus androsaceus JB14]